MERAKRTEYQTAHAPRSTDIEGALRGTRLGIDYTTDNVASPWVNRKQFAVLTKWCQSDVSTPKHTDDAWRPT